MNCPIDALMARPSLPSFNDIMFVRLFFLRNVREISNVSLLAINTLQMHFTGSIDSRWVISLRISFCSEGSHSSNPSSIKRTDPRLDINSGSKANRDFRVGTG